MADTSQRTRWPYSLIRISENKEGNRLAVARPNAHELIGVDGQLLGGLRPFPGFKVVHEFVDLYSVSGYNNPLTRQPILECAVVSFLIGSSKYGVAVIYRPRRSNTLASSDYQKSDIYMDWWSSGTKKWTNANLLMSSVPVPPAQADPPSTGKQMSVAVTGRLVYVFVEDQQPVMFWIDDSGSPEVLTKVTDTGPNRRPTLNATDELSGLGSIRTTGATDRDGHGQVTLLEYYPSEVGLGLTQPDTDVRALLAGNYTFAYRLRDSVTGRVSGLSEISEARTSDFDPLSYQGSNSGSGSGFSSGTGIAGGGTGSGIPLFAALEICYNPDKYDQAYIYRSVRVESAGGTFTSKILFLEGIIDLADYATVNSPLPTESGKSRAQSIYYYTLEDKMLLQKPTYQDREIFDEEMPYGGSAIFYEGTLVSSKLRTAPAPSSDENTLADSYLGIGSIRWSSLTELSPELFGVYNRYVPSPPSDDVLTFHFAGPNLLGFSKNRQYVIRKDGTDLRIEPMHDGYGIVSYHAADTVGSLVYLVTTKGVKTIDAYGQLEAVNGLNEVFVETWKGTLEGISVAYDSVANTLFILNPDFEQLLVLWFNTAMVTEVHDASFQQVLRGPWAEPFTFDRTLFTGSAKGSGNAYYDNPLRETALFIHNHVVNSDGSTYTNRYPRLMVVDYQRSRTQTSGSNSGDPEYTTIPMGADAVFTVTGWTGTSGGFLQVDTSGGVTMPSRPDNAYVYVLEAADPTLVGTKLKIASTSGANLMIVQSDYRSLAPTLVSGDVIGLSPVYFQWVGYPLGIQEEGGQLFGAPEDFFQTRHAEALGCYFTDVGGSEAGTVYARYKGLVYSGADATPIEVVDTIDPQTQATINTVVEGPSVYYAGFGADPNGILDGRWGVSKTGLTPGVRIICPNLDFRMVGAVVEGQVLPSARESRT